ncbi:MAG TPA: hypothetical protein VJ728_02555, partial [Candidatus Binataceae bacterium]|nr:hypothetical protein [Candidatus Binataceae bacterium]
MRLYRVLEHLGAEIAIYFQIIKELYRVCRDGAKVHIIALHPRHDDFIDDPTRVRPVTQESMKLLSQAANREWLAAGASNTTLGLQLGVDFLIESASLGLADPWGKALTHKNVSDADLKNALRSFNNVIKHVDLVLRAIKPAGRPSAPDLGAAPFAEATLVPDSNLLDRMQRRANGQKRILV